MVPFERASVSEIPVVSSKFPIVPLEVGGRPLGCEDRRCWANCPCS